MSPAASPVDAASTGMAQLVVPPKQIQALVMVEG
jgi:hypothetical protein